MSVKEALLEIAKSLPDKCTWEEVMYRIYALRQIEAGLRDEAEDRLVPHDEVFAKYGKKKGL